jgi:hypothetical protein
MLMPPRRRMMDGQLDLFALPAPGQARGEDLRVLIHRHLMRYPLLTVFEIARALGQPHPAGGERVRRQLLIMEGDGEAERTEGIRGHGDHRPAVRWTAT